MKRRLLNLLAAVSLVSCVSVVVLWLHSYGRVELVEFYRNNRYALQACNGLVEIDLATRTVSTGILDATGWPQKPAPGAPIEGRTWSAYYFQNSVSKSERLRANVI